MLDREQQAALINISMKLEQYGYPEHEFNFMFGNLHNETIEKRNDILTFLKATSRCTYLLYLEIMQRLPSESNKKFISYEVK